MQKIIQTQRDFFQSNKTRPLSFRKNALRRLHARITQNTNHIKNALFKDLGKSSGESYVTEIGLVLEEIKFTLDNLDNWSKPKRRKSSLGQFPGKCVEITEPLGVVLVISPWNYPFMLAVAPLIGAIAAGNCGIIKPSEHAPYTSQVLKNLMNKIFPSNYITVVEGGIETNKKLLEEQFDYIFFTGSGPVGKIVLKKAAEHLTPVTLELGGKSPCIVDETANLDLAAKRIVFGKFLNSGQTCIAPDYILVQKSVRNKLLEEIKKWIPKLLGEDPLTNPEYSHMINKNHFHRVIHLMDEEDLFLGGNYDEATLKIEPTVLINVSGDSPVMFEEIFGPVLPILTFEEIVEVEQFIQQRDKPLALYLFTTDKRIETRIMKGLSFGGGCVNDTILHLASPHIGFGGVGGSGYGRYHGKDSYDTFSHTKSILKQSSWFDVPLRYPPYSKGKERLLKKILK